MFRAVISDGTILECESFKTLYRCTRFELRDRVGHVWPGVRYDSISARIENDEGIICHMYLSTRIRSVMAINRDANIDREMVEGRI